MTTSSSSSSLAEVLALHNAAVSENQTSRLQRYCEQLWDWNTRLNLTRHTDFDSFVTRDLLDSRQLAEQLSDDERVLDAGSGGGVPGIILAILNPALNVSLSESTRKKAAALQAIVDSLDLPVTVFAERAEDVLRNQSFDTITARAVAPLKKLLPWFRPQRRQFQRLLLIKGPSWATERDAAADGGAMRDVDLQILHEYATAGRDGHSVVMEVRFTG